MTTYTISGFKLGYDNSDDLSSITPVELKIVAQDSEDSVKYANTGQSADSLFGYIEITEPEPYNVHFNGVSEDTIFKNPFADEDLAGFMSWGAGSTAYFLDFWDSSTNEDYIFQMGGTSLPQISTVAQMYAFYGTLTGIGAITSGAYGPGLEIALSDFTDVVVTQHDIIKGDSDINVFHGGKGRDQIFGGGGNDKLFGEAAKDKIFGGNGKDRVIGGNGEDRLFGGRGNDVIKGGNHNDYLDGGDHNDKLIGGAGDDYLYGGSGKDKFIFTKAANQGNDTIGDFQDGIDRIVIRGGGLDFLEDITIVADGNDTVVSWRQTSVTLEDIDSELITVDDFNLV